MRLSIAHALPALSLIIPALATPQSQQAPFPKRQNTPGTGVITEFQVAAPILTPTGSSNEYGCVHTQTLMEYTFASSYGAPFVGSYTPPPCAFNRVVINFTATSVGRQFDRLAIMYLGDIEVWRTSTAEPTSKGIIWTYLKEMQQYNALWRQPQKIIFDLGNIVDSTYTGPFVTTLTATFFTVPDSPATADVIFPISRKLSSTNAASVFTVPDQQAITTYTLPSDVDRAIVSLSANGQIGEEFWYSNTFNSLTETFPDTVGTLPGQGTWREVQLLIDGQLAGVAWPFPIIFTGGIVPGLWRPIVGIDTFDLRESEIDITPFLGLLLDNKPHTFEIRVASLNDDGAGHASLSPMPGSYWLVTGKIFLFTTNSSSAAIYSKPQISTPAPSFTISSSLTKKSTGGNETLTYSTTARRELSITATVQSTPSSPKRVLSWSQSLTFSNKNTLTAQGLVQKTTQSTSGTAQAKHSGFSQSFTYPLEVVTSYNQTPTSLALNGTLGYGLDLTTLGTGVFPSGIQNFNASSTIPFTIPTGGGNVKPTTHLVSLSEQTQNPKQSFTGARVYTFLNGTAEYYSTTGNGSFSFGSTSQEYTFGGLSSTGGGSVELYSRSVGAVNTSVVYDRQVLLGRSFDATSGVAGREGQGVLAEGRDVRRMLGRGQV